MTKEELVAALELWDSAPDWADDDDMPEEWREAFNVLATAARWYLEENEYRL